MGVAGQEDELEEEQVAVEQQQEAEDEGESQVEGEGGEGEGEEQEDDEVVVQIGDEEAPASEEAKAAPSWVKELRERQRQLTRENAELRAKLETGQPVQQVPKLPPEPTMADPDIDYDEDKFKAAMHGWYAKKREVEAHEAGQKAEADARQKAVQAVHENYANSRKALKVKDYQDAEDEFKAQTSQVQQSLVIAGATNPAAVVYALGRSPKKLQELASIKDPVKFAVAVGKLETEVKVTTKRTSTKPAPESTVRSGSGSASATSDTLKRLEAEADRTGDRTKVAAYKRQQMQQGK